MYSYAFATIVYKNFESAYAATVLGQSLKLIAPFIPRYVITSNISRSDELFLSQNDWILKKVSTTRWIHFLKIYLWLLPVQRIIYFDSDHVPSARSSPRILKLINVSMSESLSRNVMASPYAASDPKCFNGGFLILQPNKQTFETLRQKLQLYPRTSGAPSDSFSLQCRNHAAKISTCDQILLHHMFQNWTSTKPFWKVNSFYGCKTRSDSFHFFKNTRPWETVLCNVSQPKVDATLPPHKVCVQTSFSQRCCSYFGLHIGSRANRISSCKKEVEHWVRSWWNLASLVTDNAEYTKVLHMNF
jgi:hypothetical protein